MITPNDSLALHGHPEESLFALLIDSTKSGSNHPVCLDQ